ncbi:MAG: Ig domain protein group 2 domain protein, partial [Bacteroidetes bacterium]|nr:Ig domain protein group 2 domain protein [Bacteroidota bacterium]
MAGIFYLCPLIKTATYETHQLFSLMVGFTFDLLLKLDIQLNNMKKGIVIICLFLGLGYTLSGQNKYSFLKYVFPSDSIAGFDENAAKQEAFSRGYFGLEYKVYMYRAKRGFINYKYGYATNQSSSFSKAPLPVIVAAPCQNEDFEGLPTGSVTAIPGWTLSVGQNAGTNSSCSMLGCCALTPTAGFSVVATPVSDPVLGTISNSPLGGSNVLKISDNIINMGEVYRIEQTFSVTSSNSVLKYAYMSAIEGSSHTCCDNPYMNVLFYDCSNNLISSISQSVVIQGSMCASTNPPGWFTNSSGASYTPGWILNSVNLTPYIGSCITMQVTMGDCNGWAHYGYGYFDASCGPSKNVVVNSSTVVAAGTIPVCGSTATLNVPPGTTSFTWNGPAGSGVINNTLTPITASVSGNYTYAVNSGSVTSISVFSLSLNNTPVVLLTSSSNTACASGGTVGLSGNPSGGLYSGTGVSGSVFSPPASPGTYTVSYSYTNSVNCSNSASKTITVNICTGIDQESVPNSYLKLYPNP